MDIGVIQVQPKILDPIMHARRIGQSNNEPRLEVVDGVRDSCTHRFEVEKGDKGA
jgi:hypothetical protein